MKITSGGNYFFYRLQGSLQGLRIYGLHNRTHLSFAIYGVGVISEFYVATDESMEKIHEPNRALVGEVGRVEGLAVLGRIRVWCARR